MSTGPSSAEPRHLHEQRGALRYRVLLVRVAKVDHRRVQAALPGERPLDIHHLPVVTRVTSERVRAEETADRLRRAGGVVTIVEEPADHDVSAFCSSHPSRIAPRSCVRCGEPTCAACVREAGGEELCPRCRREHRSPRYRVRLRQLFMVFLFTVFLFEVVQYLSADRARVDPMGPVDVVVLQFASPGEPVSAVRRALNAPVTDTSEPSLYAIAPWYNKERARYGGTPGTYLRVQVRGPWSYAITPPKMQSESAVGMAWESWRYARYFHDIASDFGLDLDQFAVKVFVIYSSRRGDLAAESRGSKKARTAIVYVSDQEQNPAYAVLTVAHEIAHALGAKDLYDPVSYRARFPEGYAEPFADPPYPQRYAEVMAGDIPITPTTEREIRSLSEVRIGSRTAADMHWIDKAQADLYYEPRAQTPDDHLPKRDSAQPTTP